MKKLFIFLIPLVFFFSAAPAFSQDYNSEHISDFNTVIKINKDGTFNVKETIAYDFLNLSRHGIYRDIPYLKTNDQGKKFALDFSVISVTDELGNPYQYSVSKSTSFLKIKIGDPNETISGKHTYVINYQVKGGLTYFSDHDELYWNITGNGWQVPILAAKTTVILPQVIPVADIKADCFTGYQGEKGNLCQKATYDDRVEIISSNVLNAGQGMTIVVGFPKNIVAVVEPKEATSFFDTALAKLLVTVFIVVLIGGAILWYIIYPLWLPVKWYLYGRDPDIKEGSVRAWFDPPKTEAGRFLTPVETGSLIDERVDYRDIFAMIIHLAQRGYFKIVEKKKDDFYFIKLKDYTNDKELQVFEKDFLESAFHDKDEIRIKETKFYRAIGEETKMIYEALVNQNFFPKNPNSVRVFYNIMAGVAAATFNFQLLFSALVFGRQMPRKTIKGVRMANFARSLKNFLSSQERQLEFQAKNQMFFEKLLPYAIAFGVEKIWAKRFEDVKMTNPEWYEGPSTGNFYSGYFIGRLTSSMNSFRSSTVPPSSSVSSSGFHSGFSGGFSGGGGGGGGGGSW